MEDGDCDEKEEPSDDDEEDEAPGTPGVSVSAADVDVPDDDVEMMGSSPPRQDKAPPSPSALFCAGALDGLQFLGCSADHAEDLAARAPIVGGVELLRARGAQLRALLLAQRVGRAEQRVRLRRLRAPLGLVGLRNLRRARPRA
jgi:hypothetical protein